MDFGLTKEQKFLVEWVERLVKERVAPRAGEYDFALGGACGRYRGSPSRKMVIGQLRTTTLERFYRDMRLHMLHGRHDIAAQIVGASELGEPYDVNRAH
jgi:hypothetical protein